MVAFVGNIAAGKSTAIRRLSQSMRLEMDMMKRKKNYKRPIKIVWMLEPTDVWEERGWLEEFCKDPNQNAFWFQFGVFDSHVDKVEEMIKKRKPNETLIIIAERSFYCQRLFWEIQMDMKRAKKQQDEVYLAIWKKWKRFIPEPSMLFYFQTSNLDINMERIKNRSRDGESTYTREYLSLLDSKHKQWFTSPKAFPPDAPQKGVPCVPINADDAYHTDEEALQRLSSTLAAHLVCLV